MLLIKVNYAEEHEKVEQNTQGFISRLMKFIKICWPKLEIILKFAIQSCLFYSLMHRYIEEVLVYNMPSESSVTDITIGAIIIFNTTRSFTYLVLYLFQKLLTWLIPKFCRKAHHRTRLDTQDDELLKPIA